MYSEYVSAFLPPLQLTLTSHDGIARILKCSHDIAVAVRANSLELVSELLAQRIRAPMLLLCESAGTARQASIFWGLRADVALKNKVNKLALDKSSILLLPFLLPFFFSLAF